MSRMRSDNCCVCVPLHILGVWESDRVSHKFADVNQNKIHSSHVFMGKLIF